MARRRRWWRWALLAAGGLVVLGAASAALLYATRERPTDRSTEDVVDELRGAGPAGTAPAGVKGPEPGVYPGRGDGNEYVGFSPLDEPFGPSIPATVSFRDDGCWDYEVVLNSHHTRSWTMCTRAVDVVQTEGTTATERVFPGIQFDNTTTFVCDPPAVVVPDAADPPGSWTSTCAGSSTTLEGETDYAGVTTLVGVEQLTVGDETVEVVRVRRDARLTGAQEGEETVELWMASPSGLPVRVDFDSRVSTETPFGRIDYRDVGSVTLESMQPQR